MFSKWFGAGLILAIAALILGWIFGMTKINSMENDIRAALDNKGYNTIQVDMSGNVATLSGDAPSESAKADAIAIAENTECSACKNKRRWHEVKDDISTNAVAVQSPYTFNASKNCPNAISASAIIACFSLSVKGRPSAAPFA